MKFTVIALAGSLAAAGIVTFTSGTAAATPKPVLRTVYASSPLSTLKVKALYVDCPVGFRPVSGGSTVSGQPPGSVVRIADYPAYYRGGQGLHTIWEALPAAYKHPWKIQAHAVCIKGDPEVRLVQSERVDPYKLKNKTAKVTCPAGTRVLGVGGDMYREADDRIPYFVSGIGPADGGRSAYTRVGVRENRKGHSQVRVTAACAKVPTGWRVSSVTTRATKALDKSARLTCPKGTRPYGAGADVLSDRWPGLARMQSSGTSRNGAYASARVGYHDGKRPKFDWRLRVFGICAR